MRVLVLGAGGPAGVNVCRALDAAGHEVLASDDNPDHLIWCEPYAELGAAPAHVYMAQPDEVVMKLSDNRAAYEKTGAVFLPKPQTVVLCQDKFECGLQWRRAGLREDRIELIQDQRLPRWKGDETRWLRARHGAGAKAAINARSAAEAELWYEFWWLRGVTDFVLEGFMPGRDFSWCGIYREGELLASFARERLEYIFPHLTPEGLTGTPTRAVVVDDQRVYLMAREAVSAVDENPHGVFCVDLREDSEGFPRPTEINAGRFSTTVGLWSIYSERSNFVALAAELAAGDDSRLSDWEDLPAGLVLSRHIDCGHVFSRVPVPA